MHFALLDLSEMVRAACVSAGVLACLNRLRGLPSTGLENLKCFFLKKICEEWELKEASARKGACRPVMGMEGLVRAEKGFEQF